MGSNANVRIYRPPQQVASRARRREAPWFSLGLSTELRKWAAVMATVALVLGLVVTQFFHGQMVDMRSRAEKVRILNTNISNENVRLLSVRAQLASRTQIVSLAGKKLNLFEPVQGQVHRM